MNKKKRKMLLYLGAGAVGLALIGVAVSANKPIITKSLEIIDVQVIQNVDSTGFIVTVRNNLDEDVAFGEISGITNPNHKFFVVGVDEINGEHGQCDMGDSGLFLAGTTKTASLTMGYGFLPANVVISYFPEGMPTDGYSCIADSRLIVVDSRLIS